MWKITRNAFYKTCAVRNCGPKGNIDRSYSALAEADKICVYPLFQMWKNSRNAFLKGVRFVILARKGISIEGRETVMIYM